MTADLSDFLERLSQRTPAPGAGSSAAVVVAIAAALTEMAARFSDDAETASRAQTLRRRVVDLAEADEAAYGAVLASAGGERQEALSRASDVPLAVADAARELRTLAALLAEVGNASLRGEALAAVELADAAARAAARLVLINLGEHSADARALRARELRGTPESAAPPADWALSQRIDLSRGEIAWDRFGEGPPVVLVHGTPTWSYLWRHVASSLAERCTVYLFDLPGYGDSAAPADGEISIRTHASVLAELLDRWDLESPGIAGHDIGGGTVLRTHLLHERAFRRIALIDAVVLAPWITATTRHIKTHLDVYRTMPAHVFDRISAAHLRTAVERQFHPEVFEAYHGRWRGDEGRAAYLNKIVHFDEEDTREIEPLLADIAVPVLVLWGANDTWLDPSLARKLGELIPGAQVRLIDGAGHFAMEDEPEQVARALADFFDHDEQQAEESE